MSALFFDVITLIWKAIVLGRQSNQARLHSDENLLIRKAMCLHKGKGMKTEREHHIQLTAVKCCFSYIQSSWKTHFLQTSESLINMRSLWRQMEPFFLFFLPLTIQICSPKSWSNDIWEICKDKFTIKLCTDLFFNQQATQSIILSILQHSFSDSAPHVSPKEASVLIRNLYEWCSNYQYICINHCTDDLLLRQNRGLSCIIKPYSVWYNALTGETDVNKTQKMLFH